MGAAQGKEKTSAAAVWMRCVCDRIILYSERQTVLLTFHKRICCLPNDYCPSICDGHVVHTDCHPPSPSPFQGPRCLYPLPPPEVNQSKQQDTGQQLAF